MRLFTAGATAVAAALSFAAPAAALSITVGFTFQIDGTSPLNNNTPRFIVTNDSDPGLELVSFQVTIGDFAFNFDEIYDVGDRANSDPVAPAGGTIAVDTLLSDTAQEGLRPNIAAVVFTDFDPLETSSFVVDIDADSGNSTEDWRFVMAGGSSPAPGDPVATARALFAVPFLTSPFLVETTLRTEGVDGNTGSWSASAQLAVPGGPATAIPVPAALPLMGLGVAALVGLRRRRGRFDPRAGVC